VAPIWHGSKRPPIELPPMTPITTGNDHSDELTELAPRMGEAEKVRDVPFFEAVLADQMTFRRANGTCVGKGEFLGPANSHNRLKSTDITVNTHGNVAIDSLMICAAGLRESNPFSGIFRNIRIFVQDPSAQPLWKFHAWFNVRTP
jgi:hypothetical protein